MNHSGNHGMKKSYGGLAIEMAIDFVIMYLVMYTMIATLDHFHLNLNTTYMTLMMVAPMSIVMLIAMRSMYPSPRANVMIGVAAAAIFLASFFAMRTQAMIGDREFLRSMIPHHSGAILMCEQASLSDPEIIGLCGEIVKAQREEIARMKAILARH